jgi:thiosulfate/3-mercaptopyruvate sulfurtransferase
MRTETSSSVVRPSTVPYANPDAVVSTEWVDEHLDDASIRLLEVDVDTDAYDRGHLRGAVGINWTTQLGDPVRRDILSQAAFEQLMRESGVTNETRIIFYGDNNNWFAAFAHWLAQLYGHQNAALMNGGRKKWELEGRPLVTDLPTIRSTSYHIGQPDPRLRALLKDVISVVGGTGDGTALVDVRSPAEFNGEIVAPPGLDETAQRAGHIPGAQNIPWAQPTNEDGTFKTVEEMRELYARKGITPESPVITYCRIGERSSHTWFVLTQLLGYSDVRNYDGSWTEYGNVIALPIVNPKVEDR